MSSQIIKSADTKLETILESIDSCETQLPNFQRGWIWDNNRIIGIIASLSLGYPMGAIMQLKVENGKNSFSSRIFEGVKKRDAEVKKLILDGQQRLTSMYCATFSNKPVRTYKEENKRKVIENYYYIDINKALDSKCDRTEAVIAVPKDKVIKANLGRDVVMALSSADLEYKNEMFPVNVVFDYERRDEWEDGYKAHWKQNDEYIRKYREFKQHVLFTIMGYELPVISLEADTPKEAVCKVFENVNTGGVSLTVFELVTAMFASNNFNLRDDWQQCLGRITGSSTGGYSTDIFDDIDATTFLTAVTLYSKYKKHVTLSCKRKDILELSYEEYMAYRDEVLEGFEVARKFVLSQCIFRSVDLPYTTQIIPLSVICAILGRSSVDNPIIEAKLSQWYWCGVFGELYSSSNETRYANDVEDVVNYVSNRHTENHTINQAIFSANRLHTLYTRSSAAYKGVMALLYKFGCRDFIKGNTMNAQIAMDENPDIHHIFPKSYCVKEGLKKEKWNCIINKTPIIFSTNRSIGGKAPSYYLEKIIEKGPISETQVIEFVSSHKIDYEMLKKDDFDSYFVDRAKKLLDMIETAMGKKVPDRGSDETRDNYGTSLE